MKRLTISGASILLLMWSAYAAADSYASASFKLEVELTREIAAEASYPVRCLEGCDWEATSIECSGEDRVCRATITARSRSELSDQVSEHPPEIRPISGTVCLGIGTTSIATAVSKGLLEEQSSGTGTGTVVAEVLAGSPAELAGFAAGDLIASFNAVPVERGEVLYDAVRSMVAGQLFEATVDRNGVLVHVAGALGMATTAGNCAPADARLLQIPAVTAADMVSAPFKIVLFLPDARFELTCRDGCTWGGLGMSRCPIPGKGRLCAIAADEQHAGLSLGAEHDTAFDSAMAPTQQK